jgi:TonB-dependent starch-binding outer membrane protein SusC
MRYVKLLVCVTSLLVIQFLAPATLLSQTRTVTGRVTDSKDGSPLADATVSVVGKSVNVKTGNDGSFSINVPSGANQLMVTYVGYQEKTIAINSDNNVTVTLSATGGNLNEVVVIGYGSARRRDVTGAVATVKSKDFNQGVISSPDQLLQNKVAGLEITNNSGQPGAATTVKIRGNTSIRASNNPLYVVDGVPLDGRTAKPGINLGTNNLDFGTTPESNPLLFINPYDIAQIDVLKDASSAAIYGSRGANGVIVITTKKGTSGPAKLDFGTSFGVATYMKKYKVLSPDEFRSALKKYNQPSTFDYGGSVDALKEIAQHKLSQNYSLAFGGGNESGKFRASFFGSKLYGLIKKTSLDRYLATLNGNYKFLNQRLTFDFNLIAGHFTEEMNAVTNTAGSRGNLISSALIWNPTLSFYDNRGLYNLNSNGVGNPLAFNDAYGDVSDVNEVLANISATYRLAEGLDYKFMYAINHGTGNRKLNIEGFLVGYPGLSGQGYAVLANTALTSQTFTHTLNYRKSLSSKVTVDALLGYEYWKTNYSGGNSAATGFNINQDQGNRISIPYTNMFSNAKTQYPTSTFADPQVELQSVFARGNLNILDRYSFTATIRADGSSKFGSNNRYGYFPSFGAKWVISNESFMMGGVFSSLALRGSWGITGNQEYPAGASQEQFSLGSYNTAGQTIVANPDLKWEKTKAINVGVDYAFNKNRIFGSIDYYNKNTRDLLFQTNSIQPAPSSIYFINLPANLVNSGVEFSLGATVIERKSLGWDFNFNIAYNKNLLKNFYDVNTGLPLLVQTGRIDGQGVSGTLGQVITNGYPVNEFYLKEFQGFDTSKNAKIGSSPMYAGDPNPHVVTGFSTNLRYEKFTLSINAGGAFGFLIYNNTATSVTNVNNITSGRNIDLAAYNSAEAASGGAAASTRFLEKGDYVKLRNASIRYDIGNVGRYIKNMSASISGTNLFVITKFNGFDPEVNVDKTNNNYPSRSIEYIPYPTPRTISFALNFSL